jgi:P4 family phage/plasmid primase-like protien
MHDGIDAGGDAWNWLGCECGAVAWEESRSGCLSDPVIIDKVKRYAVEKGYFKHSELFGIPDLEEAREATHGLAERCQTDIVALTEPYILDALLVLQDQAPIELGALLGRILSKEVKSAGITKRVINKAMANRKQERANTLMDDRAGSVWRELNGYLDELIKEHHIITSKDSETIYRYDHGVYLDDGEIFVKELIEKEFSESTDENLIRNALGKVRRRTYKDSVLFNSQYVVNVKNGLLDLQTLELKPHTPDCLSTVQLDVEYNPNAIAPRFTSFLKEVLDPKDIPLMEELIGWTLIPDHKVHKAVMLVGYGRNGKGTLLGVLTKFLGEMNVSHVPLQAFGSDRYATADLDGKAANFGGDIPNTPLVNMADFKGATGNDVIRVQNKYGHAYDLRSKAKNWFSANELPITKDKTDGFFERWFLILLTHHFSLQDGTADKDLETKLTTPEELSGILNIALAGLKRLKENDWKFSYNLTVDEIREMYEIISNPAVAFMTEIREGGNSNIEISENGYIDRKDAYAEFGEFCQRKGIIAANPVQFNRLLREQTVIPVTDYRPWIPGGKDRPHCWLGIRKKVEEKADPGKSIPKLSQVPDKPPEPLLRQNQSISSQKAIRTGSERQPSTRITRIPAVG